ncbi:predicted protein [Sclerotinia sclerotiorum 1980 UF-70]|uniref:Uncharacterized protein n=1 Tax=Sclerotinia sclerotiorum (strain ATCC 18683 / 1980 / Ss-1) TaxID=665079 RepID=A7EPK4_SCLS1|nr:predicted protein [Sclerotinia sclerotiorum 1980 UF-70]EDO04770.1 predicted protein [Sclerotinia sclerotiorum 1980 UF-70]
MADEVGAKTDELWQVVSQTLMPCSHGSTYFPLANPGLNFIV